MIAAIDRYAWMSLVCLLSFACVGEVTSSDARPDAGVLDPGGDEIRVGPASDECAAGPVRTAGVYASGGAASTSGQGGLAGDVTLIAGGDLRYRSADTSPDPAEVDMPLGGTAISSADLATDLELADTIRVRGLVQAAGADSIRRIRSTAGHIIVEGQLVAGLSSAGPAQSLHLEAPNGSIYVVGTVDTSAAIGYAATGGGDIELDAEHIVIDGGVVRSAGRLPCGTIGGAGGAISMTARSGSILIRDGVLDSSGAAAVEDADAGGAGGAVSLVADSHIEVTGLIEARGGHGHGATGGRGAALFGDIVGLTGSIMIDDGFVIDVSGGGTTDGPSGAGGIVEMRTVDGSITVAGNLTAKGGDGSGEQSRGGQGGGVYLWTDKNANGIGGDLTVTPTGVIDTSGGAGGKGGSGRHNGSHGTANFPDEIDQISVLLNSETIGGAPSDGRLQNLGVIISRGGANDGWGGDVIFHGRRPAGDEDPEPGMLLLDGHGAGEDGDTAME